MCMQKRWKYKHIHIDLIGASKSGKTNIFNVAASDGSTLGKVHWYSPWRKYAFFPSEYTLYEQVCLRDIADFIEEQTRLRKESYVRKYS